MNACVRPLTSGAASTKAYWPHRFGQWAVDQHYQQPESIDELNVGNVFLVIEHLNLGHLGLAS